MNSIVPAGLSAEERAAYLRGFEAALQAMSKSPGMRVMLWDALEREKLESLRLAGRG